MSEIAQYTEQACDPTFWGFLSTLVSAPFDFLSTLDIAAWAAIFTVLIAAYGVRFAKKSIEISRKTAKEQSALDVLYEFKKDERAILGYQVIFDYYIKDEDISKLFKKSNPDNLEDYWNVIYYLNEIEHISGAIINEYISFGPIKDLFSFHLKFAYQRCESIMRRSRKELKNNKNVWAYTEQLYDEWYGNKNKS